MGLLTSLKRTAIQDIYENTCIEIIKDLSKDLAKDSTGSTSFIKSSELGLVVEDITFNNGISNLMKKYHHPDMPKDGHTLLPFNEFKDGIELVKVGNSDMSISQSLDLISSIYGEIGDEFYGALLMSKDKGSKRQIVNILHPIIVANIIDKESIIDKEKKEWTLVMYSLKEGYRKKIESLEHKGANKIDNTMDIATLVGSLDKKSIYTLTNSGFKANVFNDEFILHYESKKIDNETGKEIKEKGNDARNYIIPCQVINVGGVAYPYYGTVYSTKGLAWNLTPMMSANISHPKGQRMKEGSLGGSRICTHSGDSKTRKGLSALNHCNTTSPLNSLCMLTGSMNYASQCVALSLELLIGKKVSVKNKENKALTLQEFITENDGATKKQYIQYLKNRMADKMSGEVPKEAKPVEEEPDTEPINLTQIDETVPTPANPDHPIYPNYDGDVRYVTDDIVNDPTIARYRDVPHSLRILREDRTWEDYVEEVVEEEPINTNTEGTL